MKQQLSEQGRKIFEELWREMLPREEPTTTPEPVKGLTLAHQLEITASRFRLRHLLLIELQPLTLLDARIVVASTRLG
jgi:hypothetical protein